MPTDHAWALPGPSSFVTATAIDILRGQHTLAVLPRHLLATDEFANSLAGAIIDQVGHHRLAVERVFPRPDGELVEALAADLLFGDEPVPLSELIAHPDLRGQVRVFASSDLTPSQAQELPEVLQRMLELSRPLAAQERVTFAVVTDRAWLPRLAGGATSDVGMVSHWWWNRVARWDVTAYVARHLSHAHHDVSSEIRTETIVEVARWNLDLAAALAGTWDGDVETLPETLHSAATQEQYSAMPTQHGRPTDAPTSELLELWDTGAVDVWHGDVCLAPWTQVSDQRRWSELLWRAQARVLLPWIDLRRAELQGRLREKFGAKRWPAALEVLDHSSVHDSDVLEVGQLAHLAKVRLGSVAPDLVSCAVELARARNRIAHLRPLQRHEVQTVVDACTCL